MSKYLNINIVNMSETDIKQNIIQSLDQMSLFQQVQLLKLINTMFIPQKPKPSQGILKFSGVFDAQDTQDFYDASKDCEQIDYDEW